jgi:chromosome segregation ATPase
MRAAVAFAALLATGALACGEDPVPKLEAARAALLDHTRPKAEFWTEVERKGALAKEKAGVEKEIAGVQTQLAAVKAEHAALAAALAGARDANAQTAAAVATNRGELERIEREVTKRAAALERYEARRAEAAP